LLESSLFSGFFVSLSLLLGISVGLEEHGVRIEVGVEVGVAALSCKSVLWIVESLDKEDELLHGDCGGILRVGALLLEHLGFGEHSDKLTELDRLLLSALEHVASLLTEVLEHLVHLVVVFLRVKHLLDGLPLLHFFNSFGSVLHRIWNQMLLEEALDFGGKMRELGTSSELDSSCSDNGLKELPLQHHFQAVVLVLSG